MAFPPTDWTDLTNHGASIIGISWISFQMPSRSAGVFESTASVAVRPNAWTDLTNHGASIISISCISFQIPSPICGCSRRRSSTECLDGFNEPRGEHHQHQLHFLSDALFHLRVFESTAGVAVRPNAWTDLTNHGTSIISISCISFQMPSPTCGCSNPQQAWQSDRMLGRI